jgi:colicin import membrane protein
MLLTDKRQEFAPPHTPGLLRAVVLALIAHAVLVAVLAVGVAWKRELPPSSVEAELWSALPQEAAPPPPAPTPVETETEVPPEVKPPTPAVPAPPPPAVEKAAPQDVPSKAEIAIAKEKEREALEKRQLEKDKLAKEKADKEKADKEKVTKDKAAKEKAALEAKEKAEKSAKTDASKKAKLAQEKAEKAAKEEEKRAEELRQQQMSRLTGLASAAGNGAANSTGTAAKSTGPGAGYQGRIQAAVKPNITFTDTIVGNPKTEIEVTLAANGEILSKRVTKRSGNKAWDDAAENAIEKTRKLPLDEGKVWSPMVIVISPQTLVGQ